MENSSDYIIAADNLNQVADISKSDEIEFNFERYFKENYAGLCRYAFSFVWQKDAAEDIVQEMFFNIWKNHQSRQYSQINKAYLYKSVRNHSLNYLKRNKTANQYTVIESMSGELNKITPENESENAELKNGIEKAIEKLPLRQREIFLLSRKNELTYKEIAVILHISVKTVEAQMGSALKSLRRCLSRFLPLF